MSTSGGDDQSPKVPKLSRSSSGSGQDSKNDPSITARNNAMLGRKLAGRFTLKEIAGQGRAATVFLAEDDELGEKVAIKVLRDLDPKNIERFRREARLTRKLNHPNVIRVFEYGYEDDFIFIVMEYLKGTPLASIIKNEHHLEISRAINLVTQAARGLSHAHKKDVIHRDIAPCNIIVANTEDGGELLKVLDFGLSKLLSDVEGEKNLTTTGHVVGSPAYMSVEQVNGQELDARSDIYSLGCVLYECLTGVPPFKGSTDVATLMMHLTETPVSLTDASGGKSFPPQVENLVKKMLARNADDRFSSMEELLKELDKLRELPVAAKEIKAPEKTDSERQSIVFISHAVQDKEKALLLCKTLESETPLKCWLAVRDVPPGSNFPREIMRGIKNSSVMVVVYSEAANSSKTILRELQEAERLDLPILCVPIDTSEMSDEMRYLLGVTQRFSSDVKDEQKLFSEFAKTVMGAVGFSTGSHESLRKIIETSTTSTPTASAEKKTEETGPKPKAAIPQMEKMLIACAVVAVSAIALSYAVSQLRSAHRGEEVATTRDVRSIPMSKPTSTSKLGKCYALFLAVQDYQDPGIRDLRAPINDAKAIAAELKDNYGWEVEVVPNPEMETIIMKLNQYTSRKYNDGDQLFVSVGAHGNWKEDTKEGVVLASDAEKNDQSWTHGYIPFSRLKDMLSKGNCKHTLLALDVCFAGAFFETIATGTRSDDYDAAMSLQEVLNRKMHVTTRKVLASGELNPVYDIGPSGHSPFATRFLNVLRTYGGKNHFLRFADFAKPIVETKSGGLADGFDNDKPGSDFVFVTSNKSVPEANTQ